MAFKNLLAERCWVYAGVVSPPQGPLNSVLIQVVKDDDGEDAFITDFENILKNRQVWSVTLINIP